MKRFSVFPLFLLLIIFYSCSGLDDLIFDRHPQLSDMQISGKQVVPYDTIFASIEATNPIDGILEYQWTVKRINSAQPVIGTFDGPTDLDSVRWVAPIEGGFYELKVTVSNTAKEASDTEDIEVIVSEEPLVAMRLPAADTYYVTGQEFVIEARAEHANGLSWVRAYINDVFISPEQSQNTLGIYQFTITADSNMVGQSIVKVMAKAKNSVADAGADSVKIEVGGIIPGKNGN